MNQYFNPTRFGRLLRKYTQEHLTSYLLSAAVLAGGILVVLGSLTYMSNQPLGHDTQVALFMFGLLPAGLLFTSSIFIALGDTRGGAPVLLLPASHLEKYLVAWLYSLPVFLVLYTALFSAINAVVLYLGSHGQPYETYDFSRGTREWAMPLLSYAALHSVALLGAVFFKRLHIIRTAFSLFSVLAVTWVLNRQLIQALMPGVHPTAPFGDVWSGPLTQHYRISLPDGQWQLVLVGVSLALALLLWAAAYARLTEKQL
jgi:hypothetical protein